MLACYRKNCAQATTAGQLILPETLKLLPVYVSSLIKCDALTGSQWHFSLWLFHRCCSSAAQTVTTDDRNWLMHRIMSMNIKGTFAYLYPRIFPLVNIRNSSLTDFLLLLQHTLEEDQIPPKMIRCSYERLAENGAYVIGNARDHPLTFDRSMRIFLENGLVMYIWLGSQVNPTFVQSLFGIQAAGHFQPEKVTKFDRRWKRRTVFSRWIFSVESSNWIIRFREMFEVC